MMTPAEQRAYSTGARLLRLMGLACPAHIERTQLIEEFEEFVSTEPRREPMPLTCARGHVGCTTPGECATEAKYAARDSTEIDTYLASELEKRGTVILMACGHQRKTLVDVSQVAEAFCVVCGALRTIVSKWPVKQEPGEDEIERAIRRAPMTEARP